MVTVPDTAVVGDPGHVTDHNTLGTAILDVNSRISQYFFNVKDYGALGDGTTDDTVAIQACITASQGGLTPTVGVTGSTVFFPPGEYVISDKLVLEQFSGELWGSGCGNSPSYPSQPGQATVIRWNGNNSTPMIYIHDSRHYKIHNIRLEGKTATPPTYGIECFSVNGDGAGTNSQQYFEDLIIGRNTWSSQGLNKGEVGSGIGFTGYNSNNDEFSINRVAVSYPTSYGFYFPNSQSIWGTITDSTVDTPGLSGINTSASLLCKNISFNACPKDFIINGTASVTCYGYNSENAVKFLEMDAGSSYSCYGGVWHMGSIPSPSAFITHAGLYAGTSMTLMGIKVTNQPANTTIDINTVGGAGNNTTALFTSIGLPFRLATYDLSAGPSDALRVLIIGNEVYTSQRLWNESMSTTIPAFELSNATGPVKGPRIFSGTGSPESVISAYRGSSYYRIDGGASTTMYVKESGTGNTGWVAK